MPAAVRENAAKLTPAAVKLGPSGNGLPGCVFNVCALVLAMRGSGEIAGFRSFASARRFLAPVTQGRSRTDGT